MDVAFWTFSRRKNFFPQIPDFSIKIERVQSFQTFRVAGNPVGCFVYLYKVLSLQVLPARRDGVMVVIGHFYICDSFFSDIFRY